MKPELKKLLMLSLTQYLLQISKKTMLRFLYLNIYSILIFCAGIFAIAVPLYLISKWLLIIQIIISIKLFLLSGRLFSSWNAKKKEIHILVNRNKKEFRPDTFEIFMQAPCGRLVTREALKDLGMQSEYKNLKILIKPFFQNLKENCFPTKTVVYINEKGI
jgi:hypothetical protein